MLHQIVEFLSSGRAELAVSGLAGSLVSAIMEWTGILPALRRVVVGTLCAIYLSPLALPTLRWLISGLNVPDTNAAGLSGFLMGVLGVVFIEFLLKLFRMRASSFTSAGSK